jgi:hypothetical protein
LQDARVEECKESGGEGKFPERTHSPQPSKGKEDFRITLKKRWKGSRVLRSQRAAEMQGRETPAHRRKWQLGDYCHRSR